MGEYNKTFYVRAMNKTKGITIKDIFSDTLKPHTKQQKDYAMLAGLTGNVPEPKNMLNKWQKPWIYSRVILYGAILYVLTLISISVQGMNYGNQGVLLMVPTAIIPLAVLVFYWELNIPRNLSLGDCIFMLLFGSIFAFLIAIFVWEILGLDMIEDAYVACIPEELAKLAMVCFFLRKKELCYGLNGVVVGGAVGAGFAIMESLGYALSQETLSGLNAVIIQRGVLSIGGHVVWAAMYGGAIALAKGKRKLMAKDFADLLVIITILSAILLHFVWNSYRNVLQIIAARYDASGSNFYYQIFALLFKYRFYNIILIALAWCVLFAVIKKGIQQAIKLSVDEGEVFNNTQDNKKAVSLLKEDRDYVRLLCISGELSGKSTIVKEGDSIMIGRQSACGLRYSGNARGISGNHCSVSYKNGVPLLIDLNSTYGTFVDNTKIAYNVPLPLKNNQEFYLSSPENRFKVIIDR